jgi:hypothetical protein
VQSEIAKPLLFPLLLAAGCVIAGLYGMVHDQLSYTISPEYFHAYKFQQFGIPAEHHDRVGAAVVGLRASWWMGLFIGLPVLLVARGLPDRRTYLTRSLIAFGVVALTALVVGLGGLIWAAATIRSPGDVPENWVLPGVADTVAFAHVGIMHNASYLGGLLGIVTGIIYLWIVRLRVAGRRNTGAGCP